jgi:excisionase family DNA binding protein
MSKLLYTTNEAMDALGIKQTLLYQMLSDGRLKAFKLGRRTMIDVRSVHELVASLRPGKFTTRGTKPRPEEDSPSAT